MTTLFERKWRNEWSEGPDGVPETSKRNNEVKPYLVDFGPEMLSGETVSTKTVTPDGVTVSASSITTGVDGANTAVSITVTGTEGTVTVKVTTSSSRTLEKKVRFREPDDMSERRYY